MEERKKERNGERIINGRKEGPGRKGSKEVKI